MSEPEDAKQQTDAVEPYPNRDGQADKPDGGGMRLTRRGWTVALSMLIVLVFGLVGTLVQIPYVSLGPGPTHDTLAESKDGPLIGIDGPKTYPTSGELRLTTVSVDDNVTLLGALVMWASGSYALASREIYYPPGETDEEVKQKNTRQFENSQGAAVSAALMHLKSSGVAWADKIRVSVVAKQLLTDEADRVLDPGDQLIEVNGKKVTTAQDVRDALEGTEPKDKIRLTVRDQGKTSAKDDRTATMTLGKADDGRKEGYMGLLAGAHPEFDGLKVDIKLADVGGPSAGTMFALAIVDRLTPGELTGGKQIAGTGEITDEGAIGSIGGISFKLAAAREDGATVFLVPERNCAEAVKSAPDGLRLLKVSTLDDAVKALQQLKDGGKPSSC